MADELPIPSALLNAEANLLNLITNNAHPSMANMHNVGRNHLFMWAERARRPVVLQAGTPARQQEFSV